MESLLGTYLWHIFSDIVVGLILFLVAVNTRRATQIRDELRKLNGRMITMEVWRGEHTRQDDAHHEQVRKDVDRLGAELIRTSDWIGEELRDLRSPLHSR